MKTRRILKFVSLLTLTFMFSFGAMSKEKSLDTVKSKNPKIEKVLSECKIKVIGQCFYARVDGQCMRYCPPFWQPEIVPCK